MIYCVEDDNGIRDLMIYTLTASGYEACGFGTADEFWKQIEQETPKLILLDIMLPGEDGISILKKLKDKEETKEIPVIMATAKGAEYDKVMGLDMGADDYLAKPFGMMEMISRVKAVLRRTLPKNEQEFSCIGNLKLNKREHTVYIQDEPVALTLKEYELLQLFMDNLGVAFSRETLMSRIWGSSYVGESRTVDVHIGSLRTKLGDCGEYIETVRGVGYRMVRKA